MIYSPQCYNNLEKRQSQCHDQKWYSDSKVIDDDTNEEGEENVRKGDVSVKHVKLWFRNIQCLLNRVLQGLGVVKGVLIGEQDKG